MRMNSVGVDLLKNLQCRTYPFVEPSSVKQLSERKGERQNNNKERKTHKHIRVLSLQLCQKKKSPRKLKYKVRLKIRL